MFSDDACATPAHGITDELITFDSCNVHPIGDGSGDLPINCLLADNGFEISCTIVSDHPGACETPDGS